MQNLRKLIMYYKGYRIFKTPKSNYLFIFKQYTQYSFLYFVFRKVYLGQSVSRFKNDYTVQTHMYEEWSLDNN